MQTIIRHQMLILVLVIALGLVLRLYKINEVSLYGDELTMVYDSYSLLKTAHDQTGAFLPLTFSMGAGRPAGYVYGSIPFVAIFGPAQLGVRFLSVISGIGIMITLFLLGKTFFSPLHGIVFALITAISPWDLSLSRGGFEAHFALFLTLLGIYFMILAVKKPWLYLTSAALFGVSIHTYPTYKLTLALLIPAILYVYRKEKLAYSELKALSKRGYLLTAVLILGFFVALSINQTLSHNSEERFLSLNIFNQQDLRESIIQKLNYERMVDTLSVSGLFHKRSLSYALLALESYFKNFSLDYLLFHGDGNPRHNMSESGIIYFAELVLIAIGIVEVYTKNKKLFLLLLLWLLISPLPTALVGEPHNLRNSLMLPVLVILSGTGLVVRLKQKALAQSVVTYLIIGLIIFQFVFSYERMVFVSPSKLSRFWSDPAKQAVFVANKNKDKYDYIFLSTTIDNIEYAYPVYSKIDPSIVIRQNQRKIVSNNQILKQYGNVYIGTVRQDKTELFLKSLNGTVLYIAGQPLDEVQMKESEEIVGKDKTASLFLVRKI